MAIHVQGKEVRFVRDKIGLTVAQFAAVLGVHSSTVNRWESAGSQTVPIDGVAANLLTALRQRLSGNPAPEQDLDETRDAVLAALAVGGALIALGVLIAWIARRQ